MPLKTEYIPGSGGGGGMEVHGNEYHDPDFASEADFLSHASCHKWLGGDELNIKDLMMVLNPYYQKGWENIDGFTASHTNSGAFTTGFGLGILTTGATSNSRACVYQADGMPVYTNAPAYYNRFSIQINQFTAPTSKVAWFGILESPTAPTPTQRHMAFKIAGQDVYASCGDGSNNDLVDTGVDLVQYATKKLYIKQIGTNVYFYINGVLRVTVPDFDAENGEWGKATLYVLNSAAEVTTLKIWPLKMYLGED